MSKGYDCATPMTINTATIFKNNGYDFICRYIEPNKNSWKRLSKNEAEIIQKVGMKIVSVFERNGDQKSLIGSNGQSDGQAALQAAIEIGQPKNSTIYFAVDYDASLSDMNNIEAYLRAVDLATPNYHIGVYGSFAVIEEMAKRGVCKYFWQTLAWSHGKISKYANIYQINNDVTIHGVGVDENKSYGNEGWWNNVDDILKQLSDLTSKVSNLEQTIKSLEKTNAPDWFTKEFGGTVLNGIVFAPIGDEDFWRNIAVTLRLFKSKKL